MDAYDTESTAGHGPGASSPSPAGETGERMSASAARLREDAKQQAEALTRDVQDRGKEFIEEKKSVAAGELTDVAGALRASADRLHETDHDHAGRYVSWAADEIESFAGLLSQRDVGRLFRDGEQLARRRPGVFLGGAVAAGFLLSRFMKASAQHEQSPDTGAADNLRDTSAAPATAPHAGPVADPAAGPDSKP